MKKTYTKPELYFESFELSANIASGCGTRINHAELECQPIPGVPLFVEAVNCTTTPEQNGLCYQSFDENAKLFTS